MDYLEKDVDRSTFTSDKAPNLQTVIYHKVSHEVASYGEKKLTLKAPITTAADDIHKYFFIVF